MAVAFEDISFPGNSPVETLDILKVGFEARRVCKVPWGERWAFIWEHLMEAWPYSNTNAYCVKANVEPFADAKTMDGGNGLVSFEYAMVTLYYTSNVFKSGSVIGWESLRGYQMMMPLTLPTLRWGAASGDVIEHSELPPFYMPGLIYKRGYLHVPYIPSGILTAYGKVNNAPIVAETLGLTFNTETLKFTDFECSRSFQYGTSNKWSLEYTFAYNPTDGNGWNRFWRPDANAYVALYLPDGTQYKPNVPTSFSGIFP